MDEETSWETIESSGRTGFLHAFSLQLFAGSAVCVFDFITKEKLGGAEQPPVPG